MFAAKDDRFVHMVAGIRSGSSDEAELVRFATEVTHMAADQGLTLPIAD
ncbi:hypothetical protein H4W31_006643 [Plantactinospora soyae]|uniref:Uncharacterized protein n=1 Tax=Plantactinospora soyae TaxID=1544732 RepID=A0A927MH21_9ACTN|nr:hypothetical protein [Plantactinospora soyae]